MLVSEPDILDFSDPIMKMVAIVNGNDPEVRTLRTGVYQIGSFGSSGVLRNYEHYPKFDKPEEEDWRNAYGVCDNLEQLLKHFPELEAPGREFVVTLTEVRRENQSPDGGWRWHKWGPYIGTHEPKHEYLYDESIDAVLVYHIYERKGE